MTWARALVVLPLAALVSIGAIRAMTFVAPSDHKLRALEPAFGSHPEVLVNRAMGEIGTAAARGGSVPRSAREALESAARKSPLAPDPFLVEGTLADMANDPARAEQLFIAARTRNPRSQGARYFLAERYIKTNRILPGLVEAAALARLSERASEPLIPALAAYARSPGAIPELRRFFKLSPEVRDRTLALLAGDPRNAALILELAPESLSGAPTADWHGRLIQSLVTAGDYAGAEALWNRIAGVANRGLLYNPQFRDTLAPPPFNWQLGSGMAGVAEASDRGGLDVIYYGREEVSLASQLLRLVPGRYRLAMRVDGPSRASGMAWSVECVPGTNALLELPLGTVGRAVAEGAFDVPAADCAAQMLQLRGRPGESSGIAQLTILDLKLDPLVPAR
ncbi:MAG: hypothetical protein LH610_05835 [Sphingomonas bacterium]|nr:hypothetical protein [Sphingomonas bacterium]